MYLEDAMDFLPFCPRGSSVEKLCREAKFAGKPGFYRFCNLPPITRSGVTSPHVKSERSRSLLNDTLNFVRGEATSSPGGDNVRRHSSFQFWFHLLKSKVFPTLFPAICRKFKYFNQSSNSSKVIF